MAIAEWPALRGLRWLGTEERQVWTGWGFSFLNIPLCSYIQSHLLWLLSDIKWDGASHFFFHVLFSLKDQAHLPGWCRQICLLLCHWCKAVHWRDSLGSFTQHAPRSIQGQPGWIPPLLCLKSMLKYESSYLCFYDLENKSSRRGFLGPRLSVYEAIINSSRIPSKMLSQLVLPRPS